MKENCDLQVEVAWACRILALEGHDDLCLGHVSARTSDGQTLLMKRRGIGLDEVKVDDILHLDFEGNKLDGAGAVHLEYPFHTEVYKLRPEVGAVIHTHPIYSTALSATTTPLKMVNHDSTLFFDGLPRFDDTPELVVNAKQGHAVARQLQTAKALLLRNHGVLIVGKDVPWAVITALTLERTIKLQMIAGALGNLDNVMSHEEAAQLYPEKFRDNFISDYWNFLIRRAERLGAGVGQP